MQDVTTTQEDKVEINTTNEIDNSDQEINTEEPVEVKKETQKEETQKEEKQTKKTNNIQKKFVITFKKDKEEQAQMINDKMTAVNNSPIGEIPFEDVVTYLFENKLEENDYNIIRSNSFERKTEDARIKYNRENKTSYSKLEFLAKMMGSYFH